MAVITIPDEPTDITYSVGPAPTTGPWSFSFSYFEKADLRVQIGDVELAQSGFAVTGVEVEGGFAGGSLTVSDEISSTSIRIFRDVPAKRTDNFSPAAAVSIRDLDVALDRLVAMIQDTRTQHGGDGEGGGSVSWVDVTGKPVNLTALAGLSGAADKLAYFTSASGMALASLSTYSRGLLALTNVDDWATALGLASGGGSVAWVDVTGKPAFGTLSLLNSVNNGNWSGTDLAVANGGTGASDAPGARTNLGVAIGSNVQAYSAVLAAVAGLSPTNGKMVKFTSSTTATLIDVPATGPRTMANFVTDFAGSPGGSTATNDAALAAAEASAYTRIWIPEGTFAITTNYRTLTKTYEGPGRLSYGGSYRFGPRALRTNPGYNTDANSPYGEDKVTAFSIIEDININLSTPRHKVDLNGTEPSYFGQQFAPHWVNLTIAESGGYSGLTARIPAGVLATATSATFDSVEGLAVDMYIGFGTVMDDVQEIHKITDITGPVVTWDAGLTNNYPNQGIASGEYLGPSVTKGKRTWNSAYMVHLVGQSGGDNIAYGARLEAAYVPTAGQKHFFNTQTTGVLEGDITLSTKGNYAKVTEFSVIESETATGGNGAICDVRTLYRRKAFGYGAVWGGYYITASSSVGFSEDRCDFAFNIGGKFIRGLDTYRADFTDGAAINLKGGHRVYFNSTQTATGHPTLSRGEGYYGNVIGDSWIGHEAGAGTALSIVKGTTVLSLTPTSITLNKDTAITGTLSTSSKVTISAGGLEVTGAVTLHNSLTAVNLTASGNITGAAMALSGAFNGNDITGAAIIGTSLSVSGVVVAGSYVKTTGTTFAGLPSASSAGAGARSFITDCNTSTFGANAGGGGGSAMPVYSSGAVWIVG